ncbi:MAG TPA: DNA-formamidopyrimidine glycosylase family protein [Lentimicrobium sp.]|jgi:endonuclease-8|nr:DNA-formamidopyrimidine glycosylase family protein [Lentimicrobium sp.]
MPEGPSIYLLSEELQGFIGQEVLNVRGNSKAGINRIENTVISGIRSWGKHLLISLNNGITIRIHFMLFGRHAINERKPERIERLGIDTPTGEFNFYACSVKILEEDINSLYDWSSDVMNDRWDPEAAKKKISERPDELICDILLYQDIFSGIGNIIKNEVLFRQKVHPQSVVSHLPAKILNSIIKDAREYSFLFLEWRREFVLKKNLQVHNKKLCPRCNLPIPKKIMGKTKRKAHFCSNCQILY